LLIKRAPLSGKNKTLTHLEATDGASTRAFALSFARGNAAVGQNGALPHEDVARRIGEYSQVAETAHRITSAFDRDQECIHNASDEIIAAQQQHAVTTLQGDT
jgi:hypothetical protein